MHSVLRIAKLGLIVVGTFAVMFAPWLYYSMQEHSLTPLAEVFTRMFPFGRGLYEDKVANFWCVSGLVVKWNRLLAQSVLVKAR